MLLTIILGSVMMAFFEGIAIPTGSIDVPVPGQYIYFFRFQNWAVILIAALIPLLLKSDTIGHFFVRFDEGGGLGKRGKAGLFLALFSLSLAVHFFILLQMYLTDDESAYRFTSQLLATGRLKAASFPMKEFFDRIFMINDGRFYAQYYYGWPFLLAIGEFIGIPYIVNSALFALSALLLYEVIKSFTSAIWALAGTLFFAFSPLMLVGSATYLSHTATTFFFLVFLYFYGKFENNNDDTTHSPLMIMALAGGAILLIRPYTAVLLCMPFVVMTVIRCIRKRIFSGCAGFFSVGLVVCALFFFINHLVYGSPLGSGYGNYETYAKANKFVFSYWNPTPVPLTDFQPPFFSVARPYEILEIFLSTFTRMGFDGVMVPVTMLFVVAIFSGIRLGIPYFTAFIVMLLGHSIWPDPGIDTFGPVHLSETVPLGILFFITLCHRFDTPATRFLRQRGIPGKHGGMAVVSAVLICSTLCYLPPKLINISIMAKNISTPYRFVRKSGIHNAVVFSSVPFVQQVSIYPLHHFRYWRDNPSAALDDDIIWVNDFSLEKNRELRRVFPGREFYKMAWTERGTRLEFIRLPKNDEQK